jgi:DNA-binding response OmpR family regulator
MSTRTDPQLETLRILVVDDDRDVRQILGERLRLEGFDPAFAPSGELALVRWTQARQAGEPFDVLILDIQMLGLSGIEALRLVRQIDQEVTILMISGLGDLSRAVQSLRQGADDYISKPIKIWDLRDRISTARGRRRVLARRDEDSNSKGLGWGSWIHPVGSAEERDARSGVANHRREATREGSQANAAFQAAPSAALDDRELGNPNERNPNTGRSRESRAASAFGRSQDGHSTLNREPLGREQAAERAATHPDKGREKSLDSIETRKTGPGESSSSMGGLTASGKAPGREAPPSARLASRPGGSSLRPGGGRAAGPSSPLDAFFLLAERMEGQREGWRGHGQRVADRALRIAGPLAAELGLNPMHLEALRLAAQLHGLGLVRARGQGFRDASFRDQAPYEHGTSGFDRGLFSNLAQGQDCENLQLVAQLLRAARDASHDREARSIQLAEQLLEEIEKRRLECQSSSRCATPTQGSGETPALTYLISIYELADRWVHLTSPGLEGLGSQHAHGRLADTLLRHKRGDDAFPWQRALQTLLTAS